MKVTSSIPIFYPSFGVLSENSCFTYGIHVHSHRTNAPDKQIYQILKSITKMPPPQKHTKKHMHTCTHIWNEIQKLGGKGR